MEAQVNEQADPVDTAIKVLKRLAERRKKETDWESVERDLRAFLTELALANTPELRGVKSYGLKLVTA
jgi:hypothetical protein